MEVSFLQLMNLSPLVRTVPVWWPPEVKTVSGVFFDTSDQLSPVERSGSTFSMPFSNRSFLADPLSVSQNKEFVFSLLIFRVSSSHRRARESGVSSSRRRAHESRSWTINFALSRLWWSTWLYQLALSWVCIMTSTLVAVCYTSHLMQYFQSRTSTYDFLLSGILLGATFFI
jgi:hypothetical protein